MNTDPLLAAAAAEQQHRLPSRKRLCRTTATYEYAYSTILASSDAFDLTREPLALLMRILKLKFL
jgi:hypothetical protein